ncbi:MAG: hypothetical protein HOJ35_01720 [Bdellovibrionales bacterium]|nr:hypothetical protein [Bdellovibrionales bacterium]
MQKAFNDFIVILAQEYDFLEFFSFLNNDRFSFIILFFVNLFFIRLISAFILKVTIGEALMGFTSKSSRPISIIRILIGDALLFFFIGKIFILFKHRSLEEYIVNQEIVLTRITLGVITTFFILPFTLLFAIFSPMVTSIDFNNKIKVKVDNNQSDTKGIGDYTSYNIYSSDYFRFSNISNLDNDRFILLPHFNLNKDVSKLHIDPELIILDKKTLSIGVFKKGMHFNLIQLLSNGVRSNFSSGKIFPNIERFMVDNKVIISKGTRINKAIINEAKLLMQDSLSFTLSNFLNYIFKSGPFISGTIDLRNQLLILFNHNSLTKYTWTEINKGKFLIGRESLRETYVKEKWLSLDYKNNSILELSFSGGENPEQSIKDFKQSFFQGGKWIQEGLGSSVDINDLNITMFSDLFINPSLSQADNIILEEYIYHYYFYLAKQGIFKQELINSLSRMHELAIILAKTGQKKYSERFLISLQSIQNALRTNQKNFFE